MRTRWCCLCWLLLVAAGGVAQPTPPTRPVQPAPQTTQTVPSPQVRQPIWSQPSEPSFFDLFFPIFEPSPPPTFRRDEVPRSVRPVMLGDQPPLRQLKRTADGRQVIVPTMRGFKIADAESPAPQNRVFLNYNYFHNLYGDQNAQLGAPLEKVNLQRTTFGVEQTILDGNASIGIKVPINFVSSVSVIPELHGFSTNVGNLTPVFKYVVVDDPDSGSLFSTGFAVTIPTGRDSLFGADGFDTNNPLTIQPFFGLVLSSGRFMFHSFTSIDVPTEANNVVMFFSNSGIRCSLDPICFCKHIRQWVPTVEVHASIPLDHRGGATTKDPVAMFDLVNLTVGVDIFFWKRPRPLRLGYVIPLTSEKAMDFEAMFELKMNY